MAKFDLAYNKTMIHEGGYSHHPNDRGGATYRGIARNHHPDWSGWTTIDELKKTEVMGSKTVFAQLEPEVMTFYKSRFWDAVQGDMIPDQGLANMLFDCAVLCGDVMSVKSWQDSLDRVVTDTAIDGQFGPKTLAATLQACHSEYFAPAKDLFKLAWIQYLVNIVHKRNEQKVFLYGWINRVLSHY